MSRGGKNFRNIELNQSTIKILKEQISLINESVKMQLESNLSQCHNNKIALNQF